MSTVPTVKKVKTKTVPKEPIVEPVPEAVHHEPVHHEEPSPSVVEPVAEKSPSKSKTTTINIDNIIKTLVTEFNLDPKLVQIKLAGLLPSTSTFKKSKKRKNDGPKKSVPAYGFFCKEFRSKIAEAEPTLMFGDVTKKVAAKWKALTPEEKAKYEALGQADKERVKLEVAELAKTKQADKPVETPVKKATRKPKTKAAPVVEAEAETVTV